MKKHQIFLVTVILLAACVLVFTGCTGNAGTSTSATTTKPAAGLQVNPTVTTQTPAITSIKPTTAVPTSTPGSSNGQEATPNGNPPNSTPPGGQGMPAGGQPDASTAMSTMTAAYTLKSSADTQSGKTFTASKQDESGVAVISGLLTLKDCQITTSGDTSSMDYSSFYGLNAAVLAESRSEITLDNCVIKTSGTGANGVFACGDGSVITLNDVTIKCYASGAHGVDATLSGSLILNNANISTTGNGAAAAIATDRGGGTIKVTGGNILTSGARSPGIYSTGDISVDGAVVLALGSEGAVIEGKNSITLTNTRLEGQKECGVMVYQSMSGDASLGTGNFIMTGGILTAKAGPLLYCTNTDALIKLSKVTIKAESGILLNAAAGNWGNAGSNGASVTLTLEKGNAKGDIACDSISSVDMTLADFILTGAVNKANAGGKVRVSLDETSNWIVTADSYLTSLRVNGSLSANIQDNGHNIYYDASDSANDWLNGRTITLPGGGKLTPAGA